MSSSKQQHDLAREKLMRSNTDANNTVIKFPDGTARLFGDSDSLEELCEAHPQSRVMTDVCLVDDVPEGRRVLLDAATQGGIRNRLGECRRYVVTPKEPDVTLTAETYSALTELLADMLLALPADQMRPLLPMVTKKLPRQVSSSVIDMWITGLEDEAMLARRERS